MRGKSIVIFANQRTFDENDYDNPFIEQSKFMWVPIGPEMVEDNFFSLQVGQLTSSDNRYQPFAEFEEEEWPMGLWELQRGRTVGYKDLDIKPNVLAAVTIERDLNLYKTERVVQSSYAVWFAMLGGVTVGLYIIFYGLEYFLTFKSFQNYMASELYYIPEEVEDPLGLNQEEPGCCGSRKTDGLTRERTISRDFHNEIIPEDGKVLNTSRVASWCKIFRLCSCCCRRRRIERIFKKARVYNAQELNVTSIVKSQRESQAALQILMDKFGYYEAIPVVNEKVKRAVRLSDDECEDAAPNGVAPNSHSTPVNQGEQESTAKDIENQNRTANESRELIN